MGTKTASVTLEGEALRFAGRSGSGHAVAIDDVNGDTGVRPSELVPMALAGCTAMDVVSILRKKRQRVSRYEVLARGIQRDEPPAVFTRIDVTHVVHGFEVDPEAVRRAIELSATRYCAVGATLASGLTEIHHAYVLCDADGVELRREEVVVLGPAGRIGGETPQLVETPA